MSAGSETAASAAGGGRRYRTNRAAVRGSGTGVGREAAIGVVDRAKAVVSGSVIAVVAAIAVAGRCVTVAIGIARRRVIVDGRNRAISAVIAIADAGGKTFAIGDAVESAEVIIHGVGGYFGYYQYAAAITLVIEIGIVPAVPAEVAVPAHVRISETERDARTISVAIAIAETGRIIGADAGSVVAVVSVIVVEIRPAGLILGFQTNVVVTGPGAVVFTVGTAFGIFVGVCSGHFVAGTGGIVDIVGRLGSRTGRRATRHYDDQGCSR